MFSGRVERRLEEAKVVAALQFPGIPLDWCEFHSHFPMPQAYAMAKILYPWWC